MEVKVLGIVNPGCSSAVTLKVNSMHHHLVGMEWRSMDRVIAVTPSSLIPNQESVSSRAAPMDSQGFR
jgi:hypothetical protein